MNSSCSLQQSGIKPANLMHTQTKKTLNVFSSFLNGRTSVLSLGNYTSLLHYSLLDFIQTMPPVPCYLCALQGSKNHILRSVILQLCQDCNTQNANSAFWSCYLRILGIVVVTHLQRTKQKISRYL